MNDYSRHIMEYVVFLGALGLLLFLFFYFRYNPPVMIILALLGSCLYSLWGIIHHAIEGRLTKFIALEYILFGGLIFVLLFTVLSI